MPRGLIAAFTIASCVATVSLATAQAPAPAPAAATATPGSPARPGSIVTPPGAKPAAPGQPGVAAPGAASAPGAPAAPPPPPGKVFRWVDRSGTVHYADTPPQGQQATQERPKQ